MKKKLLIIGCSATKLTNTEPLPAVIRYSGPAYKVLQTYLREKKWPNNLSIGVLSAKYGLIGGLTHIENYDLRMNKNRALELRNNSTEILRQWANEHDKVNLLLGKDYLSVFNIESIKFKKNKLNIFEGGIGYKLNQLHSTLREYPSSDRLLKPINNIARPLYFLPDWDDMLDANFEFKKDMFSHEIRANRQEVHCVEAMKPRRVCDGILISLAQFQSSKGMLKKYDASDISSLSPISIKKKIGLESNQLAFGDCGAFSYVNCDEPLITTQQAAALYQIYGFDLGASVDHIPVSFINNNGVKKELSKTERYRRIKITKENADKFLSHHKEMKYSFIPVGVVQALSPKAYITQMHEYIEMGYKFIAFGGLVPRSDAEISQILRFLKNAKKELPQRINDTLWIHLFGVFRPKIQEEIRQANISSFDSASYFRKAWLRSDQNYLGANGNWYAAIRIPNTDDPRTIKRLESSQLPINILQQLEKYALKALHDYGKKRKSLTSTLDAISNYDFLLTRSDDHGYNLIEQYKRTLESRIWEQCDCPVCYELGIDIVIFRGYNRNKRRGAHNTMCLFNKLKK